MRKTLCIMAASLAIGAALAVPSMAQKSGNPNPGVVPINARVGGLTYGEWGARWWQWLLPIPATDGQGTVTNPLIDPTGAGTAIGQSGEVYFLAGTWGGAANDRALTIPPGKKLFFPVLNWAWFSFPTDPLPWPTEQEMITNLTPPDGIWTTGAILELHVIVDGKSLKGLDGYWAVSPVFDVPGIPEDNIYGVPLDLLQPTGGFVSSLTTGFWIMLEPLPAGEHVVRFGGTTTSGAIEATYHLTVLPPGKK